jgi:hypothetical protein
MCPARSDARSVTGEVVTADGGIMAAGPRVPDLVNNNLARCESGGANRGSTGVKPTIHTRLDLAGDTR